MLHPGGEGGHRPDEGTAWQYLRRIVRWFRIDPQLAERPSRGRAIASNYWSSTTNANNPNNAWNVNFNNGNVNNNNKNNGFYVRCVRGGK